MEIWKPVTGFEKLYEVSSEGRIRNSRSKVMKTYTINSGYECLKFTVNGVRTSHLVHRLVATAFILTGCKDCTEVNHIDEDKQNNKSTNLEWCTSAQNKQHSISSGTYDKIFAMKNSLGKKHLPSTYSDYHNVTYSKARGKWIGCIRDKGKTYGFKRFDTEEEAALHVNYIIGKYGFTDRPKNKLKEIR